MTAEAIPAPASSDGGGAAAELRVTRALAHLGPMVRRVPFTISVVVLTLVVGLVTGALFGPVSREPWYPDVAYGVPALQEGRVWTFVTGWFFALSPAHYVTAVVVFALLVAPCEIRMGTRRTAVTCVVGEVGGLLVACGLVLALSTTEWAWAREVAGTRDVGFTTGMLTVVALTTATLRSPWRLRVRIALFFYVTIAFLFSGTLSDVAHLVGVLGGLAVGQWRYRVEQGFGPRTRRETRLLVFAVMIAIGVTEIVTLAVPAGGPLGPSTELNAPLDVLIDVVLIALLAGQLRMGRRWAWWVAIVLSGFNVLAAAAVLVVLLVVGLPPGASVSLGSGLLWVILFALLVPGRRAFRVGRRRAVLGGVDGSTEATARARALLTEVGGSTMSWMTTWPEMRYLFLTDGRGYVGYERHAGVALALADPVVPAGTTQEAVAEFTADAERGGLVPCLFSVTHPVAEAATAAGWRAVQIAEDTLIDLPDLQFKGKPWQDVRSAVNKAKREGVTFRMGTLADEPFAILAQVRLISEQWAGDKGLPEMGFTLGGVDEALDPAVRVGIAIDADGSLHGVTSWLPVYGPQGAVRGWTLDVMRRRPGGFRPVMEFMIAQACLAFKETGAAFVSLSGAPLARSSVTAEQLPQVERVLDTLGGAIEPLYGFRSLHAFKEKFLPRHEPIYLAYRDESDLPRIGIALTRAYLPGVSTAQLVRAGLAGGKDQEAAARA